MERYALIHTKMPREFVLLQGTGCRWRKCTFCDYHQDVSENPFTLNESVLIAFLGVVSTHDLLMMIAFQYAGKLVIEACFGTPMAYAAVHAIRRFIEKKGR